MNFKKYHVSKNLFDEIYPSISGTIRYRSIFVGDGTFTLSTTTPYDSSVANVFLLSGNVSSGASTPGNGAWLNHKVTTQSIDGYVTIAYRHYSGTTSPVDCQTMLNTGSQPLPYEPYSSEVWHDIPYYQHKTATDTLTLPAVIYPNDTTITVGVKGQSSQNGTPTPQSPVDVNGTGERTGNLFNKMARNANNGYISDGYLKSDGSKIENEAYRTSEYIAVSQSQSYTIVYGGQSVVLNVPSVCFYDNSKNFISGVAYKGRMSVLFATPQSTAYLRISFRDIDSSDVMLNLGSTALPYEPYGYKIPISCGGTTNNVYLGEVQTTRRIRKMRLVNPSSRTTTSKGYTRLAFNISEHVAPVYSKGGGYCNIASWQGNYNEIGFVAQEFSMFITQDIPEWGTLEGATEWLNSNEVYVWYVLANEETAVVNEPLMKIDAYADSLTTTIPCTAGENTLDVQTTVQPSEVSAGFSGWHPVSAAHERENGQWD